MPRGVYKRKKARKVKAARKVKVGESNDKYQFVKWQCGDPEGKIDHAQLFKWLIDNGFIEEIK